MCEKICLCCFTGAYQPPAASQNYHYDPIPEPVRQAAAAPPPSSGVSHHKSAQSRLKNDVEFCAAEDQTGFMWQGPSV